MMQKNNFSGYHLTFSPRAKKALKNLEIRIAEKIDAKIHALVSATDNLDIKKMQGLQETYRLRVGDYRVIFEVHKHIITILIVEVGHRKDVYKDY